MPDFDLPGVLRRIRRQADLSQRDLAQVIGVSKSSVAAAESGTGGLDVRALIRAAAVAGLRLALVDGSGDELAGMAEGTVRDRGGRRFPAHLDTRYSDEGWWHGPHRYDREQPWYTFDRDRVVRDRWRSRWGDPPDHLRPAAGDSPQERRAARQRAAQQRSREEFERRRAAGELPPPAFTCSCPPLCDELEDWSGRPVHAGDCPCSCDVG